jgi:hypothetical protein
VLEHASRFYRSSYDNSTASRVDGELSVELKSVLDSVSRAQWYPRRYLVEMLHAFAIVNGTTDATYADFLRCGSSLADANNEFAKLLMRVMTPELFLKKLPRFWSRDHKGSGAFELEPAAPGEQRFARITLRSVKHYDHAAILWLGFIQGVLAQLGATKLAVTQEGWSWDSPGPQDIAYEVRWS